MPHVTAAEPENRDNLDGASQSAIQVPLHFGRDSANVERLLNIIVAIVAISK
jgi:hypothetical protein